MLSNCQKFLLLLVSIYYIIDCSFAQSCTYRLAIGKRLFYNQAIRKCQELGGSLAMVKNYSQQLIIERMIKNQYRAPAPYFWLGGDRIGKDGWYWLDGTPIPINPNPSNGIKWGRENPNNANKRFDAMLISNFYTLQIPGTPQNRFYLESVPDDRSFYSVCEIPSSGRPCDSQPCFNNAICVNVGCSYKCNCANETNGRNCQFSHSPRNDVFNNTFTLTCQVKGIFSSTLIWKIKSKKFNNQYTKIRPSGSPFVVRNSSEGDVATFSLTMVAGGLCLDESIIGCFALSPDDTDYLIHEFNINQAYYIAINQSYYVFPPKIILITNDEAKIRCNKLGGQLPSIMNDKTATSLAKALDKEKFFSRVWIGLTKQSDGQFVWPNQQPVSFANWAVNEPTSQGSCAYLSRDYTWKTEQCSGPYKAEYICEVYGDGYPRFIRVEAPCGNGSSSQLDISWKASPNMQNVEHIITVRNKNEIYSKSVIDTGTDGKVFNSFVNLQPNVKYNVTISVAPSFCFKPISISRIYKTAFAAPGLLKKATINRNNNLCKVAWTVTTGNELNIQFYVINVTKSPNVASGNYNEIKQLLQQESFLQNISIKERSFTFPSLPNRLHTVEIFGQTCAGSGIPLKASGSCVAPISGPNFIPSPILTPSTSSDKITIAITPSSQLNGPISCYFVIGQYFSNFSRENLIDASKSLFNKRSRRNTTNLREGTPYIALAFSRARSDIVTMLLGDGKETSCDVTNFANSSTLSRKESNPTPSAYTAINFPLLENKHYKFYIICTTPSTSGVIFTASNPTFYYVKSQEEIPLALIILAAFALFLLLLLLLLPVRYFCKKNRKSKEKIENPASVDSASHSNNYEQPQEQITSVSYDYMNVGHSNINQYEVPINRVENKSEEIELPYYQNQTIFADERDYLDFQM